MNFWNFIICRCCGLCTLPWNRRRDFEQGKAYKDAYTDAGGNAVVHEQPGVSTRGDGGVSGKPQGGYIKHVLGDEREDEMDANLGGISSLLGNLKAQATAMGNVCYLNLMFYRASIQSLD